MKYAIAALFLATPAAAQNTCLDRAEALERLESMFLEVPAFRGLMANGNMLELAMSEDRGTWTLMVTQPGGPLCVIASGRSGSMIDPPIPGEPG